MEPNHITAILGLLFGHWINDFALQSEEDAMNKSHNFWHLLRHVGLYSAGMFIWICIITDIPLYGCFRFLFWMFILHLATDYFSSKVTAIRYKQEKFYGLTGFWSIIGMDQWFHQWQIIILYYLSITYWS